ncbi:pilus assembly protein PilP [Chromatium okenii]|nr:pilus assembly protein PilP [Chromatium okenii]
MRRCLWLGSIVAFCVIPLFGCSNSDMTTLESYTQEVKQRKPRPIAPLPEIKPIETFVYTPGERRDPFVPDAQAMPVEEEKPIESELAPDPNRRKEELENVPLDSLQMVGTLSLESNNIILGIIRTKCGTVHTVKVNNYLGLNNGQIISITETEIQIREIVADIPGQWQERAAALSLSESIEDKKSGSCN